MLVAGVGAADAAVFTANPTSYDQIVGERQPAGPALGYVVGANDGLVGVAGSSGGRFIGNLVVGFDLPTLDPGDVISSATLTYRIASARQQNLSPDLPNLDTYLLNDDNPADNGAGYYYEGANDPDPTTTLLGSISEGSPGPGDGSVFGEEFYPESDADSYITFELSPTALLVLQSFYLGSDPIQDEAFFRWNLSDNQGTNEYNRWVVDVTDTTGFDDTPLLTINTLSNPIPEPASLMLVGLGGLCLLGRRRN